MTWIFFIILILIVLFIISNLTHNKAVEQHHINQGGFRKSFQTFTNHLENFYEMTLVSDTGRSFTYSKEINDTNGNKGNLIIGIKLDMTNEPIIFSKFQSKFKGEFPGIYVSAANYNKIESIDKCINISIDKIKEQGIINYQDKVSRLTNHSVSKKILAEWNTINNDFANTKISEVLSVFINDFYIPDLINPQKLEENLDILNHSWKGLEEGYGSENINNIYYIPPAFNKFFIAAYPDVYLWYQENALTGKIEIQNKIEQIPEDQIEEYLKNPQKMNEFYRSLINQFKKEGNELETKICPLPPE